jgi:hypothetical protein
MQHQQILNEIKSDLKNIYEMKKGRDITQQHSIDTIQLSDENRQK